MRNSRRVARQAVRLAALLVAAWGVLNAGGAAGAGDTPDLYQAETLVTGQTEAGRGPALARCLTDVLVKVSGDPRLPADRRVAALAGRAATLVSELRYRDLMADLPVHDEQGTRDRPYQLTVRFDPAAIDAALATLGRKPWTGPRPRVAVLLDVHQATLAYTLTSDGERGVTMRESLEEAAARVGLPAVLPSRAVLARTGSSRRTWLAADRRRLGAAAKVAGGDVALAGRLVWSEAALGWIADWRLSTRNATYRWRIRGVNFDEAFRAATRGAAQVLSGHGQPR